MNRFIGLSLAIVCLTLIAVAVVWSIYSHKLKQLDEQVEQLSTQNKGQKFFYIVNRATMPPAMIEWVG